MASELSTETPTEQTNGDKPFDQIWVTLSKREHIPKPDLPKPKSKAHPFSFQQVFKTFHAS